MGSNAGLDTVEKRKISIPNPDFSIAEPWFYFVMSLNTVFFESRDIFLETTQTPVTLIKNKYPSAHLFWNADNPFTPTFAFVTAAKLGHAALYKKETLWIITLMHSNFVHHWRYWTDILFTDNQLSAKLPFHFQICLSSLLFYWVTCRVFSAV
jgi:hypothetical protein